MKLLCRKCNVYYEDPELKFCSKCGTTLEEVNICPKCHTENDLDFVFCANSKRLQNIIGLKDSVRLITSNIAEIAEGQYEYVFSYNNAVYFNEIFCEDSTLMLMKILQ